MPAVPSTYSVLEMEAYDTDPLPVSEILRLDPCAGEESRALQRSQKMTRSQGISMPSKQVKWEKKDVVTKGIYKPWFFTRFARLWIPLGRPQCAMDLKSISLAAKSHSRRCSKKHLGDEDSDPSEEVWVGCDACSKWRKVPQGFEFDKNKSFFCHMLSDTTCETPEEEWDEEEEFVDDADVIVDNDRSSSSRDISPGSAHSDDSSPRDISPSSSQSHDHGCQSRADRRAREAGALRGPGKRPLISPRVFGYEYDNDPSERWKRVRRKGPSDREDKCEGRAGARAPLGSDTKRPTPHRTGAAGGVGMSRLDAVVLVLRETGKALHYDVITKQALQQGIIRFTGSQGTAGESMKAFLNKTIRENKSAVIINMGKGVYGLKEWGRRGVAKEGPCPSKEAPDLIASPTLTSAIRTMPPSPADGKLPHSMHVQQNLRGNDKALMLSAADDSSGSAAADAKFGAGDCEHKLPGLVLGESSVEPSRESSHSIRGQAQSADWASRDLGLIRGELERGGSIASLLN